MISMLVARVFQLGESRMGDLDLWGDWNCRDWLKEGIAWWKKELQLYASR